MEIESVFGWSRNKAENEKAYELGASTGAAISASFNEFMAKRFGTTHDGYLNVLRGNFQSDIKGTDVPPIESARANYLCFVDEVATLERKMNAEVSLYMASWLEQVENVGSRPQIEAMFRQRVGNFCNELQADGLKLMTDYAIPLTEATHRWRKAYPELASQWPEQK
jgi:hypothetical protein